MKQIRVTGPAERDLDDIWHFVASRSASVDIANRLIDSITQAFPLLAHAPSAGTRRDEIEPELRGYPVGSYIIYYREVGPRIVIARIIHGMRDQKIAFLDRE